MSTNSKTTALVASVGADDEQSVLKISKEILPQNHSFVNPEFLTISMRELYETVYPATPPVIENLLYGGVYILAGSPKLGKSFLVAEIGYHISKGIPIWNYPTRKGTVLYLALEDDYSRLQNRLYRLFGTDCTDNLHFTTSAKQLGQGLDEQLTAFIENHNDTKLIIIDTLQKIRECGGEGYNYANDYEIISQLKSFANNHKICILLVHHTRKQQADDKFDMISGTTGILGSADGAFLLQKDKRYDLNATLDVVGRDIQDQKIHLIKDEDTLQWHFDRAETELWKEPTDPVLTAVAEIGNWSGTPTELVGKLGLDIKPNVLTLRLNINAGRLQNEYGIIYTNNRTHAGRNIELVKA